MQPLLSAQFNDSNKCVCVWHVFHLYLPEAVRAAQDTEVSIGRHFGVGLTAQNDGGYREDCGRRKRTPFFTCFQVKTLNKLSKVRTISWNCIQSSQHTERTQKSRKITAIKHLYVIISSNGSNANLLTSDKIRTMKW